MIYEEVAQRREDTLAALESQLSAVQRQLLEQYQFAERSLSITEEKALFREALQLGKWLAR